MFDCVVVSHSATACCWQLRVFRGRHVLSGQFTVLHI